MNYNHWKKPTCIYTSNSAIFIEHSGHNRDDALCFGSTFAGFLSGWIAGMSRILANANYAGIQTHTSRQSISILTAALAQAFRHG